MLSIPGFSSLSTPSDDLARVAAPPERNDDGDARLGQRRFVDVDADVGKPAEFRFRQPPRPGDIHGRGRRFQVLEQAPQAGRQPPIASYDLPQLVQRRAVPRDGDQPLADRGRRGHRRLFRQDLHRPVRGEVFEKVTYPVRDRRAIAFIAFRHQHAEVERAEKIVVCGCRIEGLLFTQSYSPVYRKAAASGEDAKGSHQAPARSAMVI